MGIELFLGCHMRGEPRALAARTDLLAGGPKSMDSTRFSIVAKIANFGPASPQQVDLDDLQVMLRALLDVWAASAQRQSVLPLPPPTH